MLDKERRFYNKEDRISMFKCYKIESGSNFKPILL